MAVWRIGAATLAAGLAIGGCTPAPKPAPPPAPTVSYDGTYTGTVSLTNVGAGVPRVGCATAPQMTLQVTNNAFTYVQTHPKATITAPGFPTESGTTTYTVAIAQNGSFTGQSDVSGVMSGTITGGHMTGSIEGIECVYAFAADRS